MHLPVIPPGHEPQFVRGVSRVRAIDAKHAVRVLSDMDWVNSMSAASRARGHGSVRQRRIMAITDGCRVAVHKGVDGTASSRPCRRLGPKPRGIFMENSGYEWRRKDQYLLVRRAPDTD